LSTIKSFYQVLNNKLVKQYNISASPELDVSGDRQSKTFTDRSFGGCRQNSLSFGGCRQNSLRWESNYPSASFRGIVLFAASEDYKPWKDKGYPFQRFGGIKQTYIQEFKQYCTLNLILCIFYHDIIFAND
jgi:hypothetical protein